MSIQSEIKKGERDAKAKQAAGRRAAKLARSLSVRSTGRASVRTGKSGGKGIVVKSQKVTHGFSGLVQYATDQKKKHELVFTNCGNPEDAIKAMHQAANRRADIRQPVGHITLSLPPQVGRETRWAEIIKKTRAELGIDDSFPAVALRHGDTAHDHVHLIFSRVSISGKVHDAANIGLRCASLERTIERDFNLKLFKSPPAVPVSITKNEIEKSLREKQQPARLQLHSAITTALEGKPTAQQFVERLQLAGVEVKANLASTGKMSGFSFSFNGISFGASKIHKDFGWASLKERIDHEEERDSSYLAQLNAGTSSADSDITKTVASIARIAGSSAPTNRAIAKSGADDRANTPSSSTPTPHTPASTSAAPTITAPAGAPVAATAQDSMAEVRRPRLDAVKPSQPTNKEQDHGTTSSATSIHPGIAYRKEFGKFKRRASPHRLRPLSEIALAPHLERGELLLRSNGRDNLAARHAKDGRDSGVRLPSSASGRARIAPPNLSQPAWQRASTLLQSYRDALKREPDDLAGLDVEAIEAGHTAHDVINARAVVTGVQHAEAALKVAEAAPTPEVLKHIETEYKQAAQRCAARLVHNHDQNSPKPPAPK